MSEPEVKITLKEPPPPHFYVQRGDITDAYDRVVRRARPGCARKGCGRPAEHPVHLRPPGEAPVEGMAASG